ncbi:hypothetical protein [Staphylococcus saprophyticus]|uniref:hypothetical protein n=1 Tax=Staphylococcus saprophyticus TaxID=29385 RepID=UPI000853A80F|nr:hypothetical protein [Staphylococcus saprophyticus]OEK41307.1 hypothetical protein ASS88_01470 [Staphylococcus saprophyticus]
MAKKKNKYVVVKYFVDLEDKSKEYNVGDAYPKPANKKISQDRIAELSSSANRQNTPLIELVEEDLEEPQEDK